MKDFWFYPVVPREIAPGEVVQNFRERYDGGDEENCTGHVASNGNAKICGRCGVHIDSLRPPDD